MTPPPSASPPVATRSEPDRRPPRARTDQAEAADELAWRRAALLNTEQGYSEYLANHPFGAHAADANRAIAGPYLMRVCNASDRAIQIATRTRPVGNLSTVVTGWTHLQPGQCHDLESGYPYIAIHAKNAFGKPMPNDSADTSIFCIRETENFAYSEMTYCSGAYTAATFDVYTPVTKFQRIDLR